MTNKLIKTKIENLIQDTKNLNIIDVVSYIKSIFPENEFSWENISKRNDFYYEHQEIVHLTNHTDLIINYPGGDRFGDTFSEPYTDIYFQNLKLINNNDKLESKLYLFINDNYNSDNRIIDYLNELLSNDNLSTEEIIMYLNKDINITYHFLDQLSDEQLQIGKAKEAIGKYVESNARESYFNAYDQYQYGQYGGEDVADWELSESLQFQKIWENLPDKIKQNCNDELERIWLQIPDTENTLNEEIQELQKRINILYQIKTNQDCIIQDIHNRYVLIKNYETNLSEDFSIREEISSLYWNCLEYINTHDYLDTLKSKITEIDNRKKEIVNKNKTLKQQNEILQQKRYRFWQKKGKNIDEKKFTENSDKINENSGDIAKLTKQLNTLYKKYDIVIQLKKDISTMIENNPIKNINLLYQNLYPDYCMYDLNNFSEKELIELTRETITNELTGLESMSKKIIDLNNKLSKINELKSTKTIEKYDIHKHNTVQENKLDAEIEL